MMENDIRNLLYLLAGICYGTALETPSRKKWSVFYAIGTLFWLIATALMD